MNRTDKAPFLVVALIPLLFCITPFLSGCLPAGAQDVTKQDSFYITKVFEHNGIVVYRFMDMGEYHYYSAPSTITFTITKGDKTEAIVVPVEPQN